MPIEDQAVPDDVGAQDRNVVIRLTSLLFLVCAANAAVWLWAGLALRGDPALLGIALVVYGLGLRHAVDGDHIAAIDNVTRRLMHQGQRPVAVGFFFALGHSSVVLIITLVVTCLASALQDVQRFQVLGGAISTGVSAVFLISVGMANLAVFRSIYFRYRQSRRGARGCIDEAPPLQSRGSLARALEALSRLITRSWQMVPLGFLFGLGFETATEVALFGLSAAQAGDGLPVGTVLVFPALFAAGMLLLDTLDGVVMLGVYQWAFIKPARKLYYNMTITLISAIVALLVGVLQAAAFLRARQVADGPVFGLLDLLSGKMGQWGLLIFLLLSGSWLLSWLVQRFARAAPTFCRRLLPVCQRPSRRGAVQVRRPS